MGGKSVRSKKELNETEVRALAHDLAERVGMAEGLDLEHFATFKLSVEIEDGQGVAKLKINYPRDKAPEGADEDGLSPNEATIKYSKLKKRMKKDFKALAEVLSSGQLPDEAVVASFLADAHLMVAFPGYGDEYYREFIKATKVFAAAWQERDLGKLQAAHQALNDCMKGCHDKYK